MSLQWTLIAGFLYLEIVVVLLLVLPVASPKRWQKIFKSRFIQTFTNQASWYFGIILLILVLFLLDAIREMRKYSSNDHPEGGHLHLDAEMQGNMRLFRAQRNFYISGFALFLSLVIRRLTTLISTQATLLAQSEAALAQAKSATTAARDIMTKSSGEAAQNSTNEAHDKEITELKEKLKKAEKDLEHSKKDREAMVSQSQSLKNEYDRLLEEHRLLQVKVSKGDGDNKKAD